MEERYRRDRLRMVATQIEPRGIRHARVLEAMRQVPRHRFVPPEHVDAAYDDRPLPIGAGQTISQPYIVAAMTAALDPRPDDSILEIGTGSGYQCAILAVLGGRVVSIERVPELAARAAGVLRELGLDNATVHVGDGTLGWPEGQPYDRIIVTAGAPAVPDPLVEQLAPGGVLVIPVGSRRMQELMVVRRETEDADLRTETLDRCVFVPLVGEAGWERGRS
jgi:protein-L-isoaspartate(D-aspartate) O-methyltransferase